MNRTGNISRTLRIVTAGTAIVSLGGSVEAGSTAFQELCLPTGPAVFVASSAGETPRETATRLGYRPEQAKNIFNLWHSWTPLGLRKPVKEDVVLISCDDSAGKLHWPGTTYYEIVKTGEVFATTSNGQDIPITDSLPYLASHLKEMQRLGDPLGQSLMTQDYPPSPELGQRIYSQAFENGVVQRIQNGNGQGRIEYKVYFSTRTGFLDSAGKEIKPLTELSPEELRRIIPRR